MTHNPTRRGILGAIAAAPIAVGFSASVSAAPAPVDRTAWQSLVDQHAIAWKRLNDHPIHDMLIDSPGYAEANEDESVCIQACMTTERAIQAAPAPDLQAVLEKLELHLRNYGEDSDGFVTSAVADLSRLAREGR